MPKRRGKYLQILTIELKEKERKVEGIKFIDFFTYLILNLFKAGEMEQEESINTEKYVNHFLKEMDDLYSFKNKEILFMLYDPREDNARAVKKLGAKKVYYYNTEYTYKEIEDGTIVLFGDKGDSLKRLGDKSIDLVIGLEILEHINDIELFFSEIKRVIKPCAEVEIQGSPMWTSHYGHHIWIENKFIFYEETNPFEPWEHLVYGNKEEMEEGLERKGYNKQDSKLISEWIYNPIEISRHTPTEIIEAAVGEGVNSDIYHKIDLKNSRYEICKKDNFEYSIKRTYQTRAINEYYKMAREIYSEEDLATYKLTIKMREDRGSLLKGTEAEIKQTENIDDWIYRIIKEFCSKHDIRGKRVLNITTHNSEAISKLFIEMGASKVNSVTPYEEYKESDKSGKIEHFQKHFEESEEIREESEIIFGLDVLTEIRDADKFFRKIKNLSTRDTAIYLTGYMPYPYGKSMHINGGEFHYYDETYPLKNWEHITNTKEEMIKEITERGAGETEAQELLKGYESSCKITPSELIEAANRHLFLYLRRIFHYLDKNEYYESAKKRYTQDDLNSLRIIITSDFPTTKRIDEVNIDKYIKMSLEEIDGKYKVKGKRILNITPFINAKISLGLEAMGAKEVVSLDYYDNGLELEGGKNIRCVRQDYEDLDNISGEFDLIYGLDVLEHVKDLNRFFNNLKRLISGRGVICITGSPLFPSDNGHNYMYDNLDCGMLKTGSGTVSLEPWEHLGYDTKEGLKSAMIKKGFTENDAETVSEYIFNSKEINRKSYAEIIEELKKVEGIKYGTKKILQYSQENEYYAKANKRYTHEELRTKEIKIYIRKG